MTFTTPVKMLSNAKLISLFNAINWIYTSCKSFGMFTVICEHEGYFFGNLPSSYMLTRITTFDRHLNGLD